MTMTAARRSRLVADSKFALTAALVLAPVSIALVLHGKCLFVIIRYCHARSHARGRVGNVPEAVIRHACSITSSAWTEKLCKRAPPPGLGLAPWTISDPQLVCDTGG